MISLINLGVKADSTFPVFIKKKSEGSINIKSLFEFETVKNDIAFNLANIQHWVCCKAGWTLEQ